MRVLYFYQYFTTPKGSYNTRVYEFTRRWVSAGDSVTVVTSIFDRSDLRPQRVVENYDIEGVDVRVINIGLSNKHGAVHRMITFAAYALVACWYGLTIPCDVVLASSGPITVGIPGLLVRYLCRRPLVFEVRDLWPEGAIQLGVLRNPVIIRLSRWLERACYRASEQVVALSEGMAQWIQGRHGIDHITVVPNASDNKMFAAADPDFELPEWAEDKKLVIYAGNLGYGDDVGQVIEMAKHLGDTNRNGVQVVIAGDGKQRESLERRVRELDLPVRFLGLVPRQDLANWLKSSACTLLVTKSAPFYDTCSPNKLFDSFAAGIPMIQTTQGWIKELMEREECGVTVRQDDPEALAKAVLRVARDDEYRQHLGQNGRRLARDVFDRDLLSAKLRKVLHESAQSARFGLKLKQTHGTTNASD